MTPPARSDWSRPEQPRRRSARPFWLGEDRRRWDHIRVHIDLVRDDRLDTYDIAVYVGLVVHAEVETGESGPSEATLAEYAKCSDRRVRLSIRKLEETQWITTVQRPGEASKYRLLPPPSLALPRNHVPPYPGTTFRPTPEPRSADPGTDPGTTFRPTPEPRSGKLDIGVIEEQHVDFEGSAPQSTWTGSEIPQAVVDKSRSRIKSIRSSLKDREKSA